MGWLWTVVYQSYALSGPVMMLLYPLYASIMAIESHDKEDDQQWLTYWVLYSLVSLMEMAAGPVIAWIPFYSTFKLIIASWLVLPQFRGGIILYEKFVSPYLNAATGVTDQKLTDGQRKWLGSISPEAQASVAAFIKENGSSAFDAFMKSATGDVKQDKIEETVEKKEGEAAGSSDSD
ncbi:HVA22-like protein e [Physcomitrium patens]|uniref:HVA22-like protein n=2 Tax=Physcomitrium patens TaxID=3218 RepID=A9U1L1_PHYPA|nr:HVA22-like protein e [Physcomitrium patens]|eukprot:XP_024392605.1 HVA22-like protein e [Physcomitrella patens]